MIEINLTTNETLANVVLISVPFKWKLILSSEYSENVYFIQPDSGRFEKYHLQKKDNNLVLSADNDTAHRLFLIGGTSAAGFKIYSYAERSNRISIITGDVLVTDISTPEDRWILENINFGKYIYH